MEKEDKEWKKTAILGFLSGMFIITIYFYNQNRKKKIYFEKQDSGNSCFTHALNMYFQNKFFPDNFPKYKKNILQNEELIGELKKQANQRPFYGKIQIPDDEMLDENSSQEDKDYDLKGYYEVSFLFFAPYFKQFSDNLDLFFFKCFFSLRIHRRTKCERAVTSRSTFSIAVPIFRK